MVTHVDIHGHFFAASKTNSLAHLRGSVLKNLSVYVTMVVSWMDPKLLMKMFTLDSTGMPEKHDIQPYHSMTYRTVIHIEGIFHPKLKKRLFCYPPLCRYRLWWHFLIRMTVVEFHEQTEFYLVDTYVNQGLQSSDVNTKHCLTTVTSTQMSWAKYTLQRPRQEFIQVTIPSRMWRCGLENVARAYTDKVVSRK